MRPEIKEFMEALKAKTVGEAEFHQAVEEVIETVWIPIRQTRNTRPIRSSKKW